MRLKRLTLHGFKTFADKTTVEFSEGVTAVVGPNGSGKCVTGETLVTLADGREVPIRDLVDGALAQAGTVESLDDGSLTHDNPLGVRVLSLDPWTFKLSSRPVTAFVKRTAPERLIRVCTRAGRQVTATPYHPLFTLDGGVFRALRADEVKPGTPLALPRSLPTEPSAGVLPIRPLDVLRRLDEKDGLYVPHTPELRAWTDQVRGTIGTFEEWSRRADVSSLALRSFRDGQAINATVLASLAEAAGSVPPLDGSLKTKGRTAGTLRLPTSFDADAARFIGLLIAEGRNAATTGQVRFVNSDPAVNDQFERLAAAVFGLPTFRKSYKPGSEDSILFSVALGRVLDRVFGLEVGSGSARKRVPPQVFSSPAEVRWAFLSGLFEGDAYISVRRSARRPKGTQAYIEYATASEELARGVVSLLLQSGVFATLRVKQKAATNSPAPQSRTYFSVYVYGGESLRVAAANLRFVGEKRHRLAGLAEAPGAVANPNHDLVPGVCPVVKAAVRTSGMRPKAERHLWPKLMAYVEGRCEASRAGLRECIGHIQSRCAPDAQDATRPFLGRLARLAESDLYWDVVESVEEVAPEDPWVYDLCVAETHNFVAGNIVVHNSNIGDSIQWVLGEQKASNLRATRAQDVIFAGSSRRKPMGMAEVSLTVDNEDRFLPLDFSEVTITRRVYRSGEGEYLINKVPCRLKDITDLFLDTGVGRGAYAIVNQSEVDSILSARPEDRRELFEEAAGIKKYRVKKREAQRKLEHTEQNLVRVRDIASEIERQLRPLEGQAATAKRYLDLTGRLREIEVGLLAADYKRFKDELDELGRVAEEGTAEAERLRAEAAGLEESAGGIGRRIAEAEAEMDAARVAQQNALAQVERVEGQIALSNERRLSAQRAAATLATDLAALSEEKGRQEAEADALRKQAQEADLRVADLNRELQAAELTFRESERALADLSRAAAGQQADYLALARKLAAQKAELDALRARLAQRADEVRDAEGRAAQRAQEAEAATGDADALAADHDAAKAAHADARRVLTEEREPARLRALEAVTKAGEARTALDRRLAEQGARLRTLEETEAAQEGYFQGVRSVTRAVQQGKLSGRYQMVADALRVPAHLDTAIEIALGASLQDVITDSEAEAKAGIRFLNETRGGRATFLPLDALRDQDVPDGLRRAQRQFSGVLGSAADLVGFDADVERAVHILLARVLIVDDLDTATRASRQIDRRDWAKIVTLSGEVVVPTGAITGGTQGRPGPNLLGRKREIQELTGAVTRGRKEADLLREAETTAKADAEAARQAVRDAEAAVTAARDAERDAERRVQSRRADADRLAREAAGLRDRAASLAAAAEQEREKEQELAAAVQVAGQLDEGAQASREDLTRRQAALSVQRDEAQAKVRAVSSELAQLKERARGLSRDAERARENALRAALSAEERTRRAKEAEEVVAREGAAAGPRLAERDAAKTALAEAVRRFEEWRDRRQALLAESFAITERVKTANRDATAASERAQAARLKAARVEAQAEAVGQRLLEEYDLHPESAVALTGGAPVDKDTAQEIARLRREIKGLGPLNPAAVQEYEEVSERHRFLTEQKADLEDARARLTAAIAEIDESTRGVFLETYTKVSYAFSRFFTRLFGGGSTELVLTNPDDVLETGIEIVAQPPGKKRQNLSLLSGGERALTAVALLFAFLEVRPAPFCVMDEVDAPLDGANVEKFADLLRDFGKESQFIVVTHNSTTMEAAPLWYGVTMQEPGVSRGLSLRVPEQAAPDAEAVGKDAEVGAANEPAEAAL
jgi:chromosome segregation protein